MRQVSVNVGYFRRIYGNFTVTANEAVPGSGYSPYCVPVPVDSRLPGGGGNQVCGLYDLNPNYVGQVSNLFTFASNFGSDIEHWNGIDASVNARIKGKVLLQGGLSTGRTYTNDCDIVNNYHNVTVTSTIGTFQSTQMCALQTPFLTQVKLLGTYNVPKVDVKVAATFQSFPGPVIAANFVASNALVQPSLGRPLSSGVNTTVNVVMPGTMYGERANQLDLRFTKLFNFGRTHTAVNLDLFNSLNANPVLSQNNTYTAAAWQTPLSILPPRLFKLSAQFDF
jgi:hypothetical protein